MRLNLPVPQRQASAERINNKPVYTLQVDAEWRQVIEPITKLKERLDRVLNCNAWHAGEVTAEDLKWAKSAGFDVDDDPLGQGICPQRFAIWLLGDIRSADPTSPQSALTRVPSWSAVGWRRRCHSAQNEADARDIRTRMDKVTVDGKDGTGDWIQPLPLVICGEGKHRAQMYARYFADMLVNLRVQRLPAATDLRLHRVLGAPQLLALQQWSDEGRWKTYLLPFPELSQPMFEALGVDVRRGWWIPWPWRAPMLELAAQSWFDSSKLALRPSRLRAALLRRR